jgi:23S rRNA (uracil1939-C5)-methyltransferase
MKYFNKIVHISTCFLQQDPSNAIRNAIDTFCKENGFSYYNFHEHTGDLRNLIIKTTTINQIMVIVQFGDVEEKKIHLLMNFLKTTFPQITSLQYIVNKKLNETYFDLDVKTFYGEDHLIEEMDGLRWKIKAKSFFQTNTQQASVLYKKILELSQASKEDIVYDLYTGVGTIALYFARYVKKVIGVEIIESAIEDAKENAKLNDIKNSLFFCGDVKDVVTEDFILQNKKAIINATVLYKIPHLLQRCQTIVYVKAPFIKRIKRSKKRDKLSIIQIIQRFYSQKKLLNEYKKSKVPIVIVKN